MRSIVKWLKLLLLESWLAKFIRGKWTVMVAPVVGAYFLVLDVWTDSPIVKDYIKFHEWAFAILLGLALAGGFFRSLGDAIPRSSMDQSYTKFLQDLLVSVGAIVTAKMNRFHYRMKSPAPKSNIFKVITHPEEQMKAILEEATRFLANQVPELQPDKIDATVVCRDRNGKWKCLVESGVLSAADVSGIAADKNSTFHLAISTGEAVFFADKAKAMASQKYVKCARDKGEDCVGSICCVPIILNNFMEDPRLDICCVSFSTYGVKLCDEDDQTAQRAFLFVCEEFSQRLKLEFMLYLIREVEGSKRKRANV